jgi:hypothetical protein
MAPGTDSIKTLYEVEEDEGQEMDEWSGGRGVCTVLYLSLVEEIHGCLQ